MTSHNLIWIGICHSFFFLNSVNFQKSFKRNLSLKPYCINVNLLSAQPWAQFRCLVPKSCLTLLRSHGWSPPGSFCPWDFPGKNTGVHFHFLLQGIFPTYGSTPHLLHWQAGSSPLVLCAKGTQNEVNDSVSSWSFEFHWQGETDSQGSG